jgi:neutral amino acid transport system permease protein
MIAILTLLISITLFSLWRWVRTAQASMRDQIGKNSSIQQEFTSRLIVGTTLSLLVVAIYISGVIGLYNYNPKAGLMWLVLLVLAFVFWRLEILARSPWGRVLKSIREDEEVPKALGKNVFAYKLQSLMLGGAIAGIAGAFFAWQLGAIYPDNFQPQLTFDAWIMVILGGSGNNIGTILGAVIYFAYDALTREFLPKIVPLDVERIGAFRIMFIGLLLMVLMIWRPQGILGKKEELTLGK